MAIDAAPKSDSCPRCCCLPPEPSRLASAWIKPAIDQDTYNYHTCISMHTAHMHITHRQTTRYSTSKDQDPILAVGFPAVFAWWACDVCARPRWTATPAPRNSDVNGRRRRHVCVPDADDENMQGGGGVSCAVAGDAPSSTRGGGGGGMLGLTLFDPPGGEQPAERIGRLVRESPVVIFARRGCCMCHVMRRLLAAVGAHATVIELDEAAEEAAASAAAAAAVPALFVGGAPVGGLDGLMGLHLSGRLVPRLREVGALCG
nr:unknown protein [Oryza sativa Japonica Group]